MKITLSKIRGLHSTFLIINPSLVVEYYIDEKDSSLVHIDYDFGMTDKIFVDEKRNCLLNFLCMSKKLSLKEKIKINVIYDLQHAFEHCDFDPNYTHTHWALKGNLYDRVKIIE